MIVSGPAGAVLLAWCAGVAVADEPGPLKALLVAGGCCHDYGKQHETLSRGIQAKANVRVDVVYSTDTSTKAVFDIYRNPDWAKGYDVIIHDECSADIKETGYVRNILDAHRSVPAVNLHCAMHSYRTGTDEWFRFAGIQSTGHGPQVPIEIEIVDPEHPATKGLEGWTTIREELYNNVSVFPSAKPLATGLQRIGRGDQVREDKAVVVWANEYEGTRVFSTTLGHNNETVADDRYLELVTRGLLWACGREGAEWRKPYTGENTVRTIGPLPEPAKE